MRQVSNKNNYIGVKKNSTGYLRAFNNVQTPCKKSLK